MPASAYFKARNSEIPVPIADFMSDFWDVWELDDHAWDVIVSRATRAYENGDPLDKSLADDIDLWIDELCESESAE